MLSAVSRSSLHSQGRTSDYTDLDIIPFWGYIRTPPPPRMKGFFSSRPSLLLLRSSVKPHFEVQVQVQVFPNDTSASRRFIMGCNKRGLSLMPSNSGLSLAHTSRPACGVLTIDRLGERSCLFGNGRPQSGSVPQPESGGSGGDAGNHPFPSPGYTASWRSDPKLPG